LKKKSTNIHFKSQNKIALSLLFLVLTYSSFYSQQKYTKDLLKADKLFIKRQFELAAQLYVDFLKKHPRDYYASKQAAICYERLRDHYSAIDYWPAVAESAEANDMDFLSYARSLIQNDRLPEAKKVLPLLLPSKDPYMSAWAKAYLQPYLFYSDSANWQVVPVSPLNTEASEFCPVMLSGKFLYCSAQKPIAGMYAPVSDAPPQSIIVKSQGDSLFFSETELFNRLQTLEIYGQFCFSPDGDYLYFSKSVSNDEMGVKSPFPFSKYQIFILKMSTLNEAKPDVKPFQYNSFKHDFIHPFVSHDGKRLFFASDMKGSMGGKDLFVCNWEDNDWSVPTNLGAEINSPGNEVYPHSKRDGTLYFASDFRPGLGGLDLFYAKADTNNLKIFKNAINAGAPINSRFDDFGIWCIPYTNKGYLSSNRTNGSQDDLYYFIYKEN